MDFGTCYGEIVRLSDSNYHARIKRRIMYTWEKVSPLISCGSTVVEIGVGPISAMLKQLKNARVIGVDLRDDQLPLCGACCTNNCSFNK